MAKEHVLAGGNVVGQTVTIPLDSVQANPWNPNRMTAETRESLKHGLETDGWLASQALLVWATDETGASKMLVIDGEHRWTLARELGFKKGPAVLLSNISEAKAKSLTVAMNHRRGQSEEGKLRDLLASIQPEFGDTLSLDVGVGNDELMKLLAVSPEELNVDVPEAATALPGIPDGPGSKAENAPSASAAPEASVRMVQLFLNSATIERFNADVTALADRYGTKTVTDTVAAAVKEAATLHSAGAEILSDDEQDEDDEG